ncbi:MAG TPA: hypothetical protein VF134_04525, partial [Candidatus Dormibacteraeota bacterium]
MTLQLLAGLVLAALCGISIASLYLAIPRRPTAEEWILHRRAVSVAEGPAISSSRFGHVWRRPSLSLQRYRTLSEAVSRDLLLLRLAGHEAPANPDLLLESIGSGAVIGAAVGAFTGLGLWWLEGRSGLPISALALAMLGGAGLPLVMALQLRLRARSVRISVRRRLPRVLTGARVLLESGAATPEGALATAAATYQDPA